MDLERSTTSPKQPKIQNSKNTYSTSVVAIVEEHVNREF